MIETPPKRILIVDDEAVVRELCRRVLGPAGYVVETAANSRQALDCVEKESFDVVVTDYRMPGEQDGLALAQLIKQRSPMTQIILMTAFPTIDTAVGTLRIGAFDYLIKPFEQTELVESVKICLAKSCSV